MCALQNVVLLFCTLCKSFWIAMHISIDLISLCRRRGLAVVICLSWGGSSPPPPPPESKIVIIINDIYNRIIDKKFCTVLPNDLYSSRSLTNIPLTPLHLGFQKFLNAIMQLAVLSIEHVTARDVRRAAIIHFIETECSKVYRKFVLHLLSIDLRYT